MWCWMGTASDMTRTVHLGKALPGEREVYDSVLEAQEAAVARVAPGVTAGEVDEAARSVLRRVELDKYFSHSTGHGVGLEIHEGPRLAAKQDAGFGSRDGDYDRTRGVYAGEVRGAD